jgi:hypothetical protein
VRRQPPSGRAVENLNLRQLAKKSEEYHRNRQTFLLTGAVAGVFATIYTAYKLKKELEKPAKLDSTLPPTDPLAQDDAAKRKIVVHDSKGREIVPTGNSVVTSFPRIIDLPAYTTLSQDPASTTSSSEYTLVGLGLRTVSFLGIGVYVVGFYIATADIAALQDALVKKINPAATTLVSGERDGLRNALLSPAESEQIWNELLASGIPARSVFRLAPVKDTDFPHLRDGLVRAIQANAGPSQNDDGFGLAMRDFRGLFNRGRVPKRKELLLVRDAQGRLAVAFDDGGNKREGRPAGRQLIGTVDDERVSRALWMNYLGGKAASEPARASIVEGIMEFVERPIGTVAAQVV